MKTTSRATMSCVAMLLTTTVLACSSGTSVSTPVQDGFGGGTATEPSGGSNSGETGIDGGASTDTDAGAVEKNECTECPKGCFDLDTDVSNCGSCGLKCPTPPAPGALATCTKGKCGEGCSGGATYCSGTCVDTKTDKRNCGSCGKTCSSPTGGTVACEAGSCKPSCSAGKTLCGSACTNADADPNNCGACGKACPAGPGEVATCSAGKCGTECSPGSTPCNGKCVNLTSDRDNCGKCGAACPADSTSYAYMCSSSKCYQQCTGSYVRCSPYALNGSSSTCCAPTSMCCMAPPAYGNAAYAYCGSSSSCY